MRAWEKTPQILVPPIIDIGSGKGPLKCAYPVTEWDIIRGDPDATFMEGVPDESYGTCFSQHCLEHLPDPITAVRNWWRILKPSGHLIIRVPHAKYYEKRRLLPSRFNPDHKCFWLPDQFDPPNTFSLLHTVRSACPSAELITLSIDLDGYVELPDDQQSPEGFHIDGIWRKR